MSEEQINRVIIETDDGVPEEIVIEVETEVVVEEASSGTSGENTGGESTEAGVPETNATEGRERATVPPPTRDPREEAIYTIRLLTAVAVGGVVEGTDQLVTRL